MKPNIVGFNMKPNIVGFNEPMISYTPHEGELHRIPKISGQVFS